MQSSFLRAKFIVSYKAFPYTDPHDFHYGCFPSPLLVLQFQSQIESFCWIPFADCVVGILLMNIPGFALPYLQILDPSIRNELSGPNFYAYYIVELVLEGSQRAIFTMLFGAGMLLFLNRLERKADGLMVAEYYFRRQLWLLVFGLFNAYILVMVLGRSLSLCIFGSSYFLSEDFT